MRRPLIGTALPAEIRSAIVAHARAAEPDEACGIVAGDAPFELGGRPLRYLPLRNALASPSAFAPDPAELVAATVALDDAGEAVWAIVHSHPRSVARPSASDLAGAADPGALQLIVGPLDGADPPVRAWVRERGAGPAGALVELPLTPIAPRSAEGSSSPTAPV